VRGSGPPVSLDDPRLVTSGRGCCCRSLQVRCASDPRRRTATSPALRACSQHRRIPADGGRGRGVARQTRSTPRQEGQAPSSSRAGYAIAAGVVDGLNACLAPAGEHKPLSDREHGGPPVAAGSSRTDRHARATGRVRTGRTAGVASGSDATTVLARQRPRRPVLTPLSRALLRAEESANSDHDAADVLVLAQDDPLAYAKLLGHIADAGRVMIVDPYLRAEPLLTLLTATRADRFLIGTNVSEKDRATMITLVNSGAAGQAELRRAKPGAVHDRLVISATGVQTIGMSLNAIGRTGTTVLMPVPEASADHLRRTAEAWWAEADVIAVAPTEGDGEQAPATAPRAPARKRPSSKAPPRAAQDKQE